MQGWLGAHTLQRIIVECDGMLEESGGHGIVSYVKMNQAHVVRYHRVVFLPIFS